MADVLPQLDGLALAVAHPGGATGRAGRRAQRMWCDVATADDLHAVLTLVDTGAGPEPVAWELRRVLAALGPRRSAAATVDALDRAARTIPGAAGTGALCVTFAPDGLVGWSAAGSAPPSAAGPDGVRTLGGDRGEPLGCARGSAVQAQAQLAAGTTVVLGMGPGPTTGAVTAALARHHDLAPAALAAVLEDTALEDTALEDTALEDTAPGALVLARLLPAPLEQRLPADPRRLSAVRRTVAAWSAAAALSEDAAADLQLLLSEAATNSVEHAYRDTGAGEFVYSVRRRRDGAVAVVVQDFGRWRPPPDDPGYRGRGLAVIHNLADEVTLDHTDHGTRIAFTVPADAAPLGERPLTGVAQGWKPGPTR
jgi:anti-sigma regulatory factor (Ser/Thr protein kinase)